jgi:hypothetical protein
MKDGDLRINASFGWLMEMYFTFDLGLVGLGFLRVEEEGVKSLVVVGFEVTEGLEESAVFASFSSNSCF